MFEQKMQVRIGFKHRLKIKWTKSKNIYLTLATTKSEIENNKTLIDG